MIERMFTEWREELIKAGRLKPDQEVDNATLAAMFQDSRENDVVGPRRYCRPTTYENIYQGGIE